MADGVRVEGAKELAAALKRFPAVSKRELARSNRSVARKGRGYARQGAERKGPVQRKMAKGIGSTANAKQAALTVRNTPSAPGATVAFYGAKRRTGWYAAPQYRASTARQHPPWIGTAWTPAVRGQGPYGINDALAEHIGDLQRDYYRGQWEVLVRSTGSR